MERKTHEYNEERKNDQVFMNSEDALKLRYPTQQEMLHLMVLYRENHEEDPLHLACFLVRGFFDGIQNQLQTPRKKYRSQNNQHRSK